ncbi:MAG TPA: hypothetical protein VI076_00705, partial [Actinopolymorphaceae bacterium]
MEQAFGRFGGRMGDGAEVELIDHARVAMGYRYRSSAVIGAPEDVRPIPPRELGGRPGTRAPHVEVGDVDGGSTLDLYGRAFVLLLGRDAADPVSEPSALTSAPTLVRTYRLDAEGREGPRDRCPRRGARATRRCRRLARPRRCPRAASGSPRPSTPSSPGAVARADPDAGQRPGQRPRGRRPTRTAILGKCDR